MSKTTSALVGLGVAALLALSPLGATVALADDDTTITPIAEGADASASTPESGSGDVSGDAPAPDAAQQVAGATGDAGDTSQPVVSNAGDPSDATDASSAGADLEGDETPEAWAKPSAPQDLAVDYVENDGSAEVTFVWNAPAESGSAAVVDYKVELLGPEGSDFHAWKVVPANTITLNRAATQYSWSFEVPAGDDQAWDAYVSATNRGDADYGDSASVRVTSTPVDDGSGDGDGSGDDGDGSGEPEGPDCSALPPFFLLDPESEQQAVGVSVAGIGHRDPGLAVSWTVDPLLLECFPVTGWIVIASAGGIEDGIFGESGPSAIATVPADARSVVLHGGTSTGPLGLPIEVPTGPFNNAADYTVLVLALFDGNPVPVGGFAEGSTLGVDPAAPAEPTGDSTGGLTVTVSGDSITAVIPGAKPGDQVFGFAFSTPVPLGWATVSATGTATWSLAGAGLADGIHHLAVVSDSDAVLGTAAFRVGALPAAVTPAASGAVAAADVHQLASTGAEAEAPFGAAVALLLAGIALVAARRIRAVRTEA